MTKWESIAVALSVVAGSLAVHADGAFGGEQSTLTASAEAIDGSLDEQIDPDTKQPILSLELEPLSDKGRTYWPGTALRIEVAGRRSRKVTLIASMRSQSYQCRSFHLQVAGERVVLGRLQSSVSEHHMSGDPSRPSFYVLVATFTGEISLEDLRRIGQAGKGEVEGKLCQRAFTLRPRQLAAVRKLVQKL